MSKALVWWLPDFSSINYGSKDEKIEEANISNILRLFNLWRISDNELSSKVSSLLGMDLENIDTINYVNLLYKQSIKSYQETFLIDIKAPFLNTVFTNATEIIKFLRLTSSSTNKERRQIYCDLIKIMFCFHEIEKRPQMQKAEENTKKLVSDNFFTEKPSAPGKFKLDISAVMEKKQWEDYFETSWKYFKTMPGWAFKAIKCTLRFRWKSSEKMMVKMLWSEKWNANITELINDSMWIELEASTTKDSIYLLEYLYFLHKEKWNLQQTDFRQKIWFYTKSDLDDFCALDALSDDFKTYLRQELTSLQKNHGTAKYQDCKFQWMVTLPGWNINGLESRVVVRWNKNQSGLSSSKIIDGKKKISAMIWLRWWVSGSYIQRIVGDISSNEDVKKNTVAIFESIIEKLVKVQIPKRSRNIYSSKIRLEEIIKNTSQYPEFIVNAIRKKFYQGSKVDDIVEAVKNWTQKGLS